MTSFGEDWDRFASRHLGEWFGRSLAISVSNGALINALPYHLSSQSVSLSQTNPSSLLLSCTVTSSDDSNSAQLLIRYNLNKFHCFTDGSYSADHTLIDLSLLLPPQHRIAQYAIEFALPVSATERVRCFMIYNKLRELDAIILLEEVRSSLFDTREPLAFTSLVGEWRGQSETFRHRDENDSPQGFAARGKPSSPSRRARRSYSEEDLPSELKNPSGSDDGLLRTKTVVQYGWDPVKGTVRRATVLSDMQDNELGRSVIYGQVDSNSDCLFDITRFGQNSANETLFFALNNGCFVMSPMRRVRGVPATGELGCLITAGFRRRLARTYGKTTVASETLASESLLE